MVNVNRPGPACDEVMVRSPQSSFLYFVFSRLILYFCKATPEAASMCLGNFEGDNRHTEDVSLWSAFQKIHLYVTNGAKVFPLIGSY